MRPTSKVLCMAVAVLFASVPAGAQTEGETIRARVNNGQKVLITTDRGDELNGRIRELTADALVIITRREQATVPFAEIVRIDHPRDTLANGAKIGFGVGALLGIAALAAEDLGCDQEETMAFFGCGDPGAGGYVVGALLLGGIGSAVGVGIDALIRRDPEIYRRVGGPRVSLAPTIGRHRRGAAVSISW